MDFSVSSFAIFSCFQRVVERSLDSVKQSENQVKLENFFLELISFKEYM